MTLLSPFTDTGKAQRGQPKRGVSPAPQILTSDPHPPPPLARACRVPGLGLEGKLVPPPQLLGRLRLVFHLLLWVL